MFQESVEGKFKRTFGVGKTKITSLLPLDHPVVKGVMQAGEALEGGFPEHVRKIKIVENSEEHPEHKGRGWCDGSKESGSTITIIADRIMKRSVDDQGAQAQARWVTLHETGHSDVANEIHTVFPENRKVPKKKHEQWANEFANKNLASKNKDKEDLFWE